MPRLQNSIVWYSHVSSLHYSQSLCQLFIRNRQMASSHSCSIVSWECLALIKAGAIPQPGRAAGMYMCSCLFPWDSTHKFLLRHFDKYACWCQAFIDDDDGGYDDDDGDGDDDGDDDDSLELLRTNTPCARHRFQWRSAHGQSKIKIGLPPDFKNPIHNKTTPQTIEQI